jgi:hypothetical protein
MVLWHRQYFKLMLIWRIACAGGIFWSSPKAAHKTLMWQVASPSLRKRASLSWKIQRSKEESAHPQALLWLPQVTTLGSYFFYISSHFSMMSHSSSNLAQKTLRFNFFFCYWSLRSEDRTWRSQWIRTRHWSCLLWKQTKVMVKRQERILIN